MHGLAIRQARPDGPSAAAIPGGASAFVSFWRDRRAETVPQPGRSARIPPAALDSGAFPDA
ncbi:MAG: hypothetical protein N2422_05770 [Rhodobacteraceae bacterium]|nr:hypothetical protein [Paracoccaceae bacterium]